MLKTNLLPALLLTCFTLHPSASVQGQWVNIPLPNDHPEVFALAVHGDSDLFIGTGGLPDSTTSAIGILWSDNHGASVVPRSHGLKATRFDRLFRSLYSVQDLLVAASADGVYFSEDHGKTWTKRSSGLPVVRQTSMKSSNALVALDGHIFCGTPAGVYRTRDRGKSWSNSSTGLSNPDVRALATLGDLLFASTDGDGIYSSADGGAHWEASNRGIPPNVRSRAMIASDGTLFAGTTSGTYRSTDRGNSWTATLPAANARSFAAGNGLVALGAFRGSGIVYISSDHGDRWTDVSANLPRGGIGVWAMAIDAAYLYAAVNRQGLWRISLQELKIQQKSGLVQQVHPAGGPLTPAIPDDLLKRALDVNKDGEISKAELQNASAALKSLDKNNDGRLSSTETGRSVIAGEPIRRPAGTRPGGAGGVLAKLQTLDLNQDGKVSRDEIPRRIQRILDRADTNRDDVLDIEEIEAFARQVRPGGRN